MNKNLNLCEILKDCPEGTKLYSTIHGEVTLIDSNDTSQHYPISVRLNDKTVEIFTYEGKLLNKFDGECILFPSKDQRDWSKFKAPWRKKERFDPKTLQAFDKVLVFDSDRPWAPLLFSYLEYSLNYPRMQCFDFAARKVIPYNKETEHLVGTTEEAPEYYRYWEE